MTRSRPGTPSLSKQLEILFKRFVIPCGVCKERLHWKDARDWDHKAEHADTGDDSAENMQPVHRGGCHQRKSAKAETQRSRIDRLQKDREDAESLERGDLIYVSFTKARGTRKIPSRPLKSRNTFQDRKSYLAKRGVGE